MKYLGSSGSTFVFENDKDNSVLQSGSVINLETDLSAVLNDLDKTISTLGYDYLFNAPPPPWEEK